VDTNFQQVDQDKFLITIPNADTINHVVVFLTGVLPLPVEAAACIFFSMPDPETAPTWNYLGYICNEKPSAIYKLSNIATKQVLKDSQYNGNLTPSNGLAFNYAQAPVHHVAQIGISIETLDSVKQMVPQTETIASKASTFEEFINKTVSNLFNYCSSFSRSAQDLVVTGDGSARILPTIGPFSSNAQFVPLSTIQDWYQNYTRRLSNDQNFWRSLS